MQPYFQAQTPFESMQLLDIGITLDDLQELFQSHQGVLQPDLEGLDLPDEIQKAISACDSGLRLEDLDRLLIYADGSSLGSSKHVAPLRAEEEGTGDTWAYVVIGERYDPPGLCLLGWNAQPVLYDSQHNNCLGAQRIGADIAEKEAFDLGITLAAQSKLGYPNMLSVRFTGSSWAGRRHHGHRLFG